MKPARLIILTIAIVAAGTAGFLALKVSGSKTVVQMQAAESIIKAEPKVKVLVASANLPVGTRLNKDTLDWADWPEGGVVEGIITKDERSEAIKDLEGAIVRIPLFEGEPIRFEKIADSNSRIMSSLLPAGKRAVATEISASTGAGGFILPNDRVDVIMVRKGDAGTFLTETILRNVRVLAIDQQYQEAKDGNKTVIGSTATLELTPEQSKVIAVAQQLADRLTLALRSVADAGESDTEAANYLLSGDGGSPSIQVIKSGNISTISQNN